MRNEVALVRPSAESGSFVSLLRDLNIPIIRLTEFNSNSLNKILIVSGEQFLQNWNLVFDLMRKGHWLIIIPPFPEDYSKLQSKIRLHFTKRKRSDKVICNTEETAKKHNELRISSFYDINMQYGTPICRCSHGGVVVAKIPVTSIGGVFVCTTEVGRRSPSTLPSDVKKLIDEVLIPNIMNSRSQITDGENKDTDRLSDHMFDDTVNSIIILLLKEFSEGVDNVSDIGNSFNGKPNDEIIRKALQYLEARNVVSLNESRIDINNEELKEIAYQRGLSSFVRRILRV